MLNRILFAGLASCALALPAAASDQDFKLVNKTGYQIDSIYVGAHSSSEWGSDIMGRDALSDGEVVNITFPRRTSACSFDIKVAYNDGDEATWDSVDLCKVSKVTLYWRNGATRAVTE
jgi:hypothetical protein